MSTNEDFNIEQSSDMDFDPTTMKVADLKRELKLRGLAVTGKKEELVERLQLAVMPVDDTSINVGPGDEDDDLLAQANALLEDDPVSSTEKKMLNRDAEQIQKKVSIKRDTIQAPSETNISNLDKAGIQQQNQKIETPNNDKITAPNSNIDSSGLKTNESNGKQDQTNKDSTPVKISDAEKAKSRAERFGVITTPNIDEKKSARAARFGITNTSKKIGESPAVDLETLKRRAERFGQSSSTALQKLELQEKIKERESRFGKVQNLATEPKRARVTAPNENLLTDEKMKKRAERFGIKA